MNITIAIDGPVCSGKGTLSIALAKKLNFLYLYTGGMYRALTLACLRSGVDLEKQEQVLDVLKSIDINLIVTSGETKLFLGEEEVGAEIFEPKVSNSTPIVSAHPNVRKEMVRRQQEIIKGKSVVIEGRDIASVVAPNAEVKIYLTADVEVRARRRLAQYQEKEISKTFEEVLVETQERDRKDSARNTSPLSISQEAIVVDTTSDEIEDTLGKVINILKSKGLYDSH